MYDNVVTDEYKIAVTELLDIFNHFPEETIKKIPEKLIDFFQNNKIPDYKCEIDYSKGLDKLDLQPKTKALLAMVYKNYLCDESQRKNFEKILIQNEEKYQQELKERYNPDKIFESNVKRVSIIDDEKNMQLIEYKEKWYQKVFKKFFKLFKKDYK